MTHRAHPPAIAIAPRAWLTRETGECAFPVGGEGLSTLACCNPSGAGTYCAAHRSALRGPPTVPAAKYEADILRWLGGRQ